MREENKMALYSIFECDLNCSQSAGEGPIRLGSKIVKLIKQEKRFAYVKSLTLCLGLLTTLHAVAQNTSVATPRLGQSPVSAVIAAMTLEEKASLVVGTSTAVLPRIVSNGKLIGTTGIKVNGAAGSTYAIPRLGIPALVMSDGPAGVRIWPKRKDDSSRTYYATAFPVGSLLASTWEPELVRLVGEAFGNEAKEYGIDILLAPGINIQRDPLNGRNFEYYSEDPLIAGKMAGAMISGIQSNGVGTALKHFAANNQETSRLFVDAQVSERALRELYLKNFRLAISEAHPWTIMSSYNKVNGVYTAERHDLLTDILRAEWKFDGFVMSDWGGGSDWVAEMKAGNDLIMPGSQAQVQILIDAVKQGKMNEKVLDANIEHILNVIIRTPVFKNYAYSNKPDLVAHAEVSRRAAREGMVLLKNKGGVLPFAKKIKSVALFGNSAYRMLAGGTGSGDVNKAYVTSLAKGLSNASYQPDTLLLNSYETYLKQATTKILAQTPAGRRPPLPAEMPMTDQMIGQAAISSDLAIVSIGRLTGEGWDRDILTNFQLTENEKQAFNKIATSFHAGGKKVVVVLNTGGPMDLSGLEDKADAILLAWQPGQTAGDAITDLLSGKENPSGKLAITWPVKYADCPSARNFPGLPANKPDHVVYEEGIYVGYRYYDSFNVKPLYEFGYGLSYTNFSVGRIAASKLGRSGKITISVTVTNTGKTAGREVAQLYVKAPSSDIDKPKQELKAFHKTRLLKPGESQAIIFGINIADLASYHTNNAEWITDAGKYIVSVGVSSRDIRQTTVFNVPEKIIVEKVHHALQPQVTINELKP